MVSLALNRRPERERLGIYGCVLTVFVGLVIGYSGVKASKSLRVDPDWRIVEGYVTRLDKKINNTGRGNGTVYSPVVRYELNGETYEVTRRIYSNRKPEVGTSAVVAYNPVNPAEAVVPIKSAHQITLASVALGVLISTLGMLLFYRSNKRTKEIIRLISLGQKKNALLTDIHWLANRFSSTTLTVRLVDEPNPMKTIRSDTVRNIHPDKMKELIIGTTLLPVYYDPMNEKKYYVDLSVVGVIEGGELV